MEEPIVLSTREEQANTILSSIPSPIFNQTTKDIDGKNAQYKAVSNRNGHLFVAFVVDRFGTVIKEI